MRRLRLFATSLRSSRLVGGSNSRSFPITNASASIPDKTKRLYAELGRYGLTQEYLRKYVLPSWWDDSATTGSGGVELALRIAEGTGLNPTSLLQDQPQPTAKNIEGVRYKGDGSMSESCRECVIGICRRVSQLAIEATKDRRQADVGQSPIGIRDSILAKGNPWVSLESLANFCWDLGVPVLPVRQFPSKIKKPDGMVLSMNGRPAIVVCKNAKPTAWMLFILAHELGHVLEGHLENGDIVDLKVTDTIDEDDEVEAAADRAAIAMLTGDPNTSYRLNSPAPKAKELASKASEAGNRDGVDPGHIVLNYVHGLNGPFYALGNKALSILEPNANALKSLAKIAGERMDLSNLSEDHAEYLLRMMDFGTKE